MKRLRPLQIARKCVGMRVLRKNKDKKILLRWKNIRIGAKEIEYAAKKQHCAKNAEFQRKAGQARPGVVRLAEYFVAAPPKGAAYRLCAASASSVLAGNAGAAQREYAYPPSVQSARAY